MKKKITLSIIIALFILTGCNTVKETPNKTNIKEVKKDGIKYKNQYFIFDRTNKNNEMSFNYSNEFSIAGYNSFTSLSYPDTGDEIQIRLNYFEEETLESAKSKMLNNNYEELEVNNIKWYHGTYTLDDGAVNSAYITEYNNKIYFYSINKNDDTKAIEDAFLKGITFE